MEGELDRLIELRSKEEKEYERIRREVEVVRSSVYEEWRNIWERRRSTRDHSTAEYHRLCLEEYLVTRTLLDTRTLYYRIHDTQRALQGRISDLQNTVRYQQHMIREATEQYKKYIRDTDTWLFHKDPRWQALLQRSTQLSALRSLASDDTQQQNSSNGTSTSTPTMWPAPVELERFRDQLISKKQLLQSLIRDAHKRLEELQEKTSAECRLNNMNAMLAEEIHSTIREHNELAAEAHKLEAMVAR